MQEPVSAQNAGERLQTRCERETLSRFPRTGAILFTIRTHMRKLSEFEGRPDKVSTHSSLACGCLLSFSQAPNLTHHSAHYYIICNNWGS